MGRREKISDADVAAFCARSGWQQKGDALVRVFSLASYAAGVAFAVRVAFLAEARDHHPDLRIGYREVEVAWTTHDAGGITTLDLELAEATSAALS